MSNIPLGIDTEKKVITEVPVSDLRATDKNEPSKFCPI